MIQLCAESSGWVGLVEQTYSKRNFGSEFDVTLDGKQMCDANGKRVRTFTRIHIWYSVTV